MPHTDILDRADSLNRPLLGSMALHVAVFGAVLLSGAALSRTHEVWGDANSGGPGSVAINVVNKIPLPSRSGLINPLANDTESAVPTPPPLPSRSSACQWRSRTLFPSRATRVPSHPR